MSNTEHTALVPIYRVGLTVCITDDINAARKARDATFGEWEHDPHIGALTSFEWPDAALFFKRGETTHGDIGHEVFHLACRIMDEIGASCHHDTSEEPYAYLIDWLTTEVYSAFMGAGEEIKN